MLPQTYNEESTLLAQHSEVPASSAQRKKLAVASVLALVSLLVVVAVQSGSLKSLDLKTMSFASSATLKTSVKTIYATDPAMNTYRSRRLDLLEQFFKFGYYQRDNSKASATAQSVWTSAYGDWQTPYSCPVGQFPTGLNAQMDRSNPSAGGLVGLYMTCDLFAKGQSGAINLDVRIQNLEYMAGTVMGTAYVGGTDTYLMNSGGSGIWNGERSCAPGEYICGFEAQALDDNDHVGLTGLVSVCCVFPTIKIDDAEDPDQRLTALENYAKSFATLPPTLSTSYASGFPMAASGIGSWRGQVLCGNGQYVSGAMLQYQADGTNAGVNGIKEVCSSFNVYKTAETPAPTLSPTPVPSFAPSPAPSEHPIALPTDKPIAEPTDSPIAQPTEAPNAEPTASPTPIPSEEPTRSPIVSPTWNPVANPTQEPTLHPSAKPSLRPTPGPTYKNDPLFCPFTYVKGDYNEAPEGCTLFSKNDIGWDKFESSPAFYLCSTAPASPTKVNSKVFLGYGITDTNPKNPKKGMDAVGLSIIKPGKANTVTFFSGNNFDGLSATFSPTITHTLEAYDFPLSGGQKSNDAVRSVVVYSTSTQIPASCKQLFSILKMD